MNKHKILLAVVTLAGSPVLVGMIGSPNMSSQERRTIVEKFLKDVKDANYIEVEQFIKERGADAIPSTVGFLDRALNSLKRNGYYAQKRGEKDNKYYMTLRILKKHGINIGLPYSEFGD